MRELKQQTSQIPGLETFPSETDEITVLSGECSSDGQLIFKASLCCEDRSDLLPDLIEILKSLHLKTLRAEMVTIGGRIRNVLIVAAEKDHSIESVHFLQTALKSLLERSNSSDRSKRRRVLDHKLIIQWLCSFFSSLIFLSLKLHYLTREKKSLVSLVTVCLFKRSEGFKLST